MTSEPQLASRSPRIQDAEVLIVGTVRNVQTHLEANVATVARAFESAASVRWLLVESDSDDRTVALLDELKGRIPRFDYLSLGTLRSSLPLRTERLAHCRNTYRRELLENAAYQGVDYVAVVDLDGMTGLLSRDAVDHCWSRSDWDVVTANQKGPYYDIWALRHELWSPNDWAEQFKFLRARGVAEESAYAASLLCRMITIPLDADWIEVDSAFGGFAIYHRAWFEKAEYVGLSPTGAEVCEHVPFHLRMRLQGARILINPALINVGSTEYSAELTRSAKVMRRLKALARLVRDYVRQRYATAGVR